MKQRSVKVKLHELLTYPVYKEFTVDGLQNIIGNFITENSFDKLIGANSKEKAQNLYNSFQTELLKEHKKTDAREFSVLKNNKTL